MQNLCFSVLIQNKHRIDSEFDCLTPAKHIFNPICPLVICDRLTKNDLGYFKD